MSTAPNVPAKDVIVTGLPRAGATLVSALLDFTPDSVCLNAPPWHQTMAQKPLTETAYCKFIAGDFLWTRQQLRTQQPVRDFRAADGVPLTDGLRDPRALSDKDGNPESLFFARPGLTRHFTLGMKHHTLFTSVLPTLTEFGHFSILAIIRNPIDTLASWRTLPDGPVGLRNPHGLGRYWKDMMHLVNAYIDNTDRHAQMYELFIKRYHDMGDKIRVLRYEDIVRDPMIVSRALGTQNASSAARLVQPQSKPVEAVQAEKFRKSLRKYGVFTKLYYPELSA